MSKTYRCRVKRDLTEVIREEDRVVYKLRLLPVADRERMKQWFRQELIDDGATENEDGTIEMEVEGVKVEIDLEKDEVRVISESEKDLDIQIDEERDVYDPVYDESAAQEQAEEAVNKEVNIKIEDRRVELRDRAAKALRDAEGKVKARIRKSENKAIEKGLDEKAESVGDVVQKDEEIGCNGDKRIIWRIHVKQ